MSIKKEKDVTFSFKDVHGKIRVVQIQVQHFQEGEKDRVAIIATSDGIPVEAKARQSSTASSKVHTKSRM